MLYNAPLESSGVFFHKFCTHIHLLTISVVSDTWWFCGPSLSIRERLSIHFYYSPALSFTWLGAQTHTYGRFSISNLNVLYLYCMFLYCGEIGRNPHIHRENMQTPHREASCYAQYIYSTTMPATHQSFFPLSGKSVVCKTTCKYVILFVVVLSINISNY